MPISQQLTAMRSLLQQYAAYNVWANHRLSYHIVQMHPDTWMQQVPSSFSSLYKTILHLWDAESIWWQRMRQHQKLVIPSAAFDPSMKDACNGLMQQSMQWEKFIAQDLDDTALHTHLIYTNSRGEQFAQPVPEVLLHVFNHGTYHRGQLITMLHAMGEKNLPATDFIVYARRAEKG